MKKLSCLIHSFAYAVGVFFYVLAVGLLLSNAQNIFGNKSSGDNFLAPLLMLLLFIISACITGLLVLGKPIILYLGGFKKEAVVMLFAILAWLIVFLAIVATALVLR